ncbi:MAG: mevalonate kinase [Candidatus Heimdallarchaeaceae archaeon]
MVAHPIMFSAPGKAILFGEHSVVYGHPAIATAINLRAKCEVNNSLEKKPTISAPDLFLDKTFTILRESEVPTEMEPLKHIFMLLEENQTDNLIPSVRITSTIPPAAGLGSSAAAAVSLTASLLKFYECEYDLDKIRDIAFESEKITHGSPSGIDNSISTFGGGILYEKGKITKLKSAITSSFLVIADSSVLRSTKNLVKYVKKRKTNESDDIQTIFNDIESITLDARRQLELGNLEEVGLLMNANHESLVKLGVGHPALTKIVDLIDSSHALGRKLTGAGGGGCIIALFKNYSSAKDLAINLENKGFPAYISNMFETGVKIEK